MLEDTALDVLLLTETEQSIKQQTRWSVRRSCIGDSRILSSFRSMNISREN